MNHKIIEWQNNRLRVLDQRLLPRETTYREFTDYHQVIDAIQSLVIRGAPLIGLAAVCGLALEAQQQAEASAERFVDALYTAAEELRACRPTAIHLAWAIDRILPLVDECATKTGGERIKRMIQATNQLRDEQVEIDQAISKAGAPLLAAGDYVLTHCNAGALATGGEGTVLAIVKGAIAGGRRVSVVICETRPMFQGARLTAWECEESYIPYTLITDSMAAHFMKVGRINAVIVGADRIAANGDVANKVGTYGLATLAKAHRIPFYVAAPAATVDLDAKSGADIPIEEREGDEITLVMGRAMVAPERARVWNPAFDITPAALVTAYITERGIISAKGLR
ncbi:MAG: S-methyl-5-thioribose-1-phosphate isomerase, partial [Nitrospirae bacterium CG_4_8_14_3_um_filter_70_85]